MSRQNYRRKAAQISCNIRDLSCFFVEWHTLRKNYERTVAITNEVRKTYMDYWHFSKEEKDELIRKLTKELPALRGAAKSSQGEIAEAIGVSRQTYNAIEMQKRTMTWNVYMSLILFFDYNPNTHYTIRQLDAFPYRLDECWLLGKLDQASEA